MKNDYDKKKNQPVFHYWAVLPQCNRVQDDVKSLTCYTILKKKTEVT